MHTRVFILDVQDSKHGLLGLSFTPNALDTTHKHTLWICGFLCGNSAHPDSDHLNPINPTFPTIPRGSRSVAGHTCLWLWAGSQQLGLGLGDACGVMGRNPRRGFIREERKKTELRSEGVTYHIVYHIQNSQVRLSSQRLRHSWKVNVSVLMEMKRW